MTGPQTKLDAVESGSSPRREVPQGPTLRQLVWLLDIDTLVELASLLNDELDRRLDPQGSQGPFGV